MGDIPGCYGQEAAGINNICFTRPWRPEMRIKNTVSVRSWSARRLWPPDLGNLAISMKREGARSHPKTWLPSEEFPPARFPESLLARRFRDQLRAAPSRQARDRLARVNLLHEFGSNPPIRRLDGDWTRPPPSRLDAPSTF